VFVEAGLPGAVVHPVSANVIAIITTRVCFVIRMQNVTSAESSVHSSKTANDGEREPLLLQVPEGTLWNTTADIGAELTAAELEPHQTPSANSLAQPSGRLLLDARSLA